MNPVPVLNNRLYDFLKYVAQILLPGMGTLYFALSQIWGLPYAGKIVGTITAVDAFLGLLLNLSSKKYEATGAKFDGDAVVSGMGEDKKVTFEFNDHPVEMAKKKDELTFKVKRVRKPAKKTAKSVSPKKIDEPDLP